MNDVSDKVIFVLVILTVVISVFSTVLLLGSASSFRNSEVSQVGPADTASISYTMRKPAVNNVEDVVGADISYKIENP